MKNAFKKHRYLCIASILVLIVGGYYGYKKMSPSKAAVKYVTVTVERGMLTTSISASGNITVDQSATVDPTISGTVANLSVNVGEAVKKGQLLFEIVNDDLSINVAKAAATYEQEKNSLTKAKIDQLQAKADYKANDKKINQQKVESADDAVETAQVNLDVSLVSYQNEVENAAKRKVVAPISGTVNAVNIKNGDDLSRISGGNNALAPIIIGDLGTLKAQVEVNEVDITGVTIGQKVMLNFDAIDGLSVSGKVEKIDSLGTINQGVVTYIVTINFDTLDQKVKPQMSVSAAIITDVKQDVLIIPSGALKSQEDNNYVEVLNSGNTPQQMSVEIGATNNIDTEIVSGIKAGDKVVTQTIDPNVTSSTTTSGNQGGFGGIRMPGVGGGGGGNRGGGAHID